MLEAAIPEHLQTERTLPAHTPRDFSPPFPAYIARYPKCAKALVMAVIGIQHATEESEVGPSLETIASFTSSTNMPEKSRPRFQELASVTDNRGFYNLAYFLYWLSREDFEIWSESSGFKTWWDSLDPETQDLGWFLEVFFPTMDRLETVFSNHDVPEGAAHMRECMSNAIQEHVYWGSMRDRLPISQTDEIVGERWVPTTKPGGPADASLRKRVRVQGRSNLAVIRSGQDWSDTLPEEHKLYVETMHPVLSKGMDFLRDHGEEVGCYSCRLMGVQDSRESLEFGKHRTFGLAYFDDLKSLESWSKKHKTHLDIFGGFLKYTKALNNTISLRLFHEVLVLEPGQQLFEYINCHSGTGMLSSL